MDFITEKERKVDIFDKDDVLVIGQGRELLRQWRLNQYHLLTGFY